MLCPRHVVFFLLCNVALGEVFSAATLNRDYKLVKRDPMSGYNDEMFNFDTLAGIGLGKRSGPAKRSKEMEPHKVAIVLDLGSLLREEYLPSHSYLNKS